jgi:hypothetical protein
MVARLRPSRMKKLGYQGILTELKVSSGEKMFGRLGPSRTGRNGRRTENPNKMMVLRCVEGFRATRRQEPENGAAATGGGCDQSAGERAGAPTGILPRQAVRSRRACFSQACAFSFLLSSFSLQFLSVASQTNNSVLPICSSLSDIAVICIDNSFQLTRLRLDLQPLIWRAAAETPRPWPRLRPPPPPPGVTRHGR